MIKIICVGKIKEEFFTKAINEYTKRLEKYTKIQMIEVPDESLTDINKIKKIESEKIKKYIDKKDYVIALMIEGHEIDSVSFSKLINDIQISSSNIAFIIGGSYGLSDEIKQIADYQLSFSKMTFPHQLFRVILLEQLYRCYKIINNESYHK